MQKNGDNTSMIYALSLVSYSHDGLPSHQSWCQISHYMTTQTWPSLTWWHIAMCGLLWTNLLSNLGPLARDWRRCEDEENPSWEASIPRLWWPTIPAHTCMQQSRLLSGWASWSPQNKSLHICTLHYNPSRTWTSWRLSQEAQMHRFRERWRLVCCLYHRNVPVHSSPAGIPWPNFQR